MEAHIPVCEPMLAGNESKYVNEALQTGWISSTGKYVQGFEEAFAQYCGVKHAVAVSNGTVALHLALAALGIGRGDEVIIPNFTMIASAFAVCYTGAIPVFVDCDSKTWNIDVAQIEAKITKKTRAIMPVHIYGLMCDMDAITALAEKYRLFVVEDAAESHGATYKGKKAGAMSTMSAFSFFANKNLTTGEGGMVLTDDSRLFDRARYFKNLCFPLDGSRTYSHLDIGFNYRMSNLHAAIGLAQVEKADEYKAMRIRNGHLYREYLKAVPGIGWQVTAGPEYENVYWMNSIILDPKTFGKTRAETVAFLKDNKIETRMVFVGMNRQASLRDFGANMDGNYPNTDRLAENGFYLPSSSSLREDQIQRICTLISDFQARG
ncbi:MAG: DegT/DnrJ/EryC1/StrS family aminotransferase [Spirochaetales bacterium]